MACRLHDREVMSQHEIFELYDVLDRLVKNQCRERYSVPLEWMIAALYSALKEMKEAHDSITIPMPTGDTVISQCAFYDQGRCLKK